MMALVSLKRLLYLTVLIVENSTSAIIDGVCHWWLHNLDGDAFFAILAYHNKQKIDYALLPDYDNTLTRLVFFSIEF